MKIYGLKREGCTRTDCRSVEGRRCRGDDNLVSTKFQLTTNRIRRIICNEIYRDPNSANIGFIFSGLIDTAAVLKKNLGCPKVLRAEFGGSSSIISVYRFAKLRFMV